ncbi:phosphomethylpyrimidine kinase [Pyrococcus furiosus DSM 3638]|uniref:Phosphomethylpyrimidine kinase n=3 Tax=Pyrococcus furiosus TaxID=2261 RepID=A0A5C0XN38_PYRFU|nr:MULTISPECIES: thiamine-phosphate synthase family protein [Pyrococcus]AAL80725.1 hypothetical protein PF0601 [Pyrococcus furiosus DSM 3638]AFN03394.1 phosphomethylpyrimidine kinase [Pyrococcus furiosus COM1]MDK2870239.1 family transcriptional regulator, thiamine biosynthesis regulator [Pyrococcus sp.]QEK78307.1 phosphomethylpyrimidine kinase [Pyrococcus furiosus DSM 3638]
MRTPSVFWAEVVIPAIRARVAKVLYSQGYSQGEIADIMGVTQAMVSKYITRYSPPEILKPLEKEIENIALALVELIKRGEKKENLVKILERKYFELLRNEEFCKAYESYSGLPGNICGEILSFISERQSVIEELSKALSVLLSDEKFPELIPEIRSNFAYSLPNPKGIEDVAAVPGRITLVHGKPFAMPPQFGASRHTAKILVRISNPQVRAVLNIRYGEDVEEALKLSGLKIARLKEGSRSEEETEVKIAELFKEEIWDAVIDPGGFGVEPCVYIFGRDPWDVIRKLRLIEKHL